MSRVSNRQFSVAVVLLALAAVVQLRAQSSAAPTAAPDSTLYTTYSLFPSSGETRVSWTVCGSTLDTNGCYASGVLGRFLVVGAMLESNPSVKGNVVTRNIYVVDSGSATSVKLYVYRKVDTVTADSDTVTITHTRTVSLPLTGGSTAQCSMAANNKFLFIGTDQGELAAMVQKSNFAVTEVGLIDAPGVTSITADQYGYVTITLGTSGFTVYDPNGNAQEDGGGGEFMLGTTQAVSLAKLLVADTQPAPRRIYRRSRIQANPR